MNTQKSQWKTDEKPSLSKRLQQWIVHMKNDYHKRPGKFFGIIFGIIYITLALETASLIRLARLSINPVSLIISLFFCQPGWLVLLAFFIIWALSLSTVVTRLKQAHGEWDERGFYYSKNGTYGTDRLKDLDDMYEAEKLNIVKVNNTLEDAEGILVGEMDGKYLTIPFSGSNNMNFAVCGSQGSSKTVFMSTYAIVQSAKAGYSMFITDPKGEHYMNTHKWLEKNGYEVKVFNSSDFKYSDGWNMLSTLKGQEEIMDVARTMIETAKKGERWDSFYDGGELNVLIACMLYVYYLAGKKERNFTAVFEMLTQNNVTDLSQKFEALKLANPRHPAAVRWAMVSDNERSLPSFTNGLLNKLSYFQNEYLREVMRHDDIDLEKPAREKCAYFLLFSDKYSTYDALNSLFINLFLARIMDYADAQVSRTCDVPIQIIFEEFPALGNITDYARKLGTLRSRKIGSMMLFQSIPQMRKRYPGEEWNEILAACDTSVYLGCNEMDTAEYYSVQTGTCTVEVKTTKKEQSAAQVSEFRSDYSISDGDGKRELIIPTELRNEYLGLDYGVLFINHVGCARIRKVRYFEQRITEEFEPAGYTTHKPEWMDGYIPEEERLGLTYGSEDLLREQRKALEEIEAEEELRRREAEEKKRKDYIKKQNRTDQVIRDYEYINNGNLMQNSEFDDPDKYDSPVKNGAGGTNNTGSQNEEAKGAESSGKSLAEMLGDLRF